MDKIKKWFESRKPTRDRNYEEEKREFEMAMGKPFIEVRVDLPEGFENLRTEFLSLETDDHFLEEVRDLVKKRLSYKEHALETES